MKKQTARDKNEQIERLLTMVMPRTKILTRTKKMLSHYQSV